MSADSSNIDAALSAKLLADAPLQALMPDGCWFDDASEGAQRFVIISLAEQSDEPMFNGRAYESALYLVKAVALNSSGADVKTAAARIDVLLDHQPLTVAGYSYMAMFRERRLRLLEIDAIDKSIRWQHRGGYYRVVMSL